MNELHSKQPSPRKVVTLVPFKSNDPSRIAVWKAVQASWRTNVGIPIFIGQADPLEFNVSLARNRAAKKAGNWDVAVILDADTLISHQQVIEGINLAIKTGAVVYPYAERWELNHEGTKMFLANPKSEWHQHAKRHAWEHFGGCIIVTRELWDLVRGFDPGFVGWGHEDGAFLAACTTLSGKPFKRGKGRLFHLEHKPSTEKSPVHPTYIANRKRMTRYTQATKQVNAPELIRNLRDETIHIV
ncbi:hypothetical protein KBD20_03110 [Candidatus Saccharibacteria bacterium]|nr:hypothetical protein [Candidatus Saccharibacteria bacterium]